ICASVPLVASPSTVSTSQPLACSAGTRQLFTSTPSSSTEQDPHSPSPQPSLTPVSPRSSRNTSSRRFIGGTLTPRSAPFTLNRISGQCIFAALISHTPQFP